MHLLWSEDLWVIFTSMNQPSTKQSFMLAFKLAKVSRPLSEGEFLKECMMETAGLFEENNLFIMQDSDLQCGTDLTEDTTSELQKKVF